MKQNGSPVLSYPSMAENTSDKMTSREIIERLPYASPFLFVDEITAVDESSIVGHYTYQKDLDFYKGHFKNNPITPGVILTETMAQIGLVAYGIYMTKDGTIDKDKIDIAMTSTAIDFFLPVMPSEKVTVRSYKEYFRFNKLKCRVEMYNQENKLVCRGTISGMIKSQQ